MTQLEYIYNQLRLYEKQLNKRTQANIVSKNEFRQIQHIKRVIDKVDTKLTNTKLTTSKQAELNYQHLTKGVNLDTIKQHIKPIKGYYFDFNNNTLVVTKNDNELIQVYVGPDEYTESHPLQISDDGLLLDNYQIQNYETWQQIYAVLDKYQVKCLEGINELVINTNLATIEFDTKRFIKALEEIYQILDKCAVKNEDDFFNAIDSVFPQLGNQKDIDKVFNQNDEKDNDNGK